MTLRSRDFKSLVSTDFTTRAALPVIIIRHVDVCLSQT
jgi:hypothetical protein